MILFKFFHIPVASAIILHESKKSRGHLVSFQSAATLTRKPVGFMQSCFFVLVSMWFPGHHMVSMCKPCGVLWKPCSVHLETMWCPHLKPCSVQLKTTWCPPENHMVSTWKPHGIHMETMWYPPGNNVVFM